MRRIEDKRRQKEWPFMVDVEQDCLFGCSVKVVSKARIT